MRSGFVLNAVSGARLDGDGFFVKWGRDCVEEAGNRVVTDEDFGGRMRDIFGGGALIWWSAPTESGVTV